MDTVVNGPNVDSNLANVNTKDFHKLDAVQRIKMNAKTIAVVEDAQMEEIRARKNALETMRVQYVMARDGFDREIQRILYPYRHEGKKLYLIIDTAEIVEKVESEE